MRRPDLAVKSKRRAVFLDRDGVINRCRVEAGKPYAPRTISDFRLLPGVAKSVKLLKAADLQVIVVTNQPDIGNGLVDSATVTAMHEKLSRSVAVDAVMMCPHSQHEGCSCRKPKPGMLLEAADRWRIDLEKSFMVGDRWGDIVAGKAAGCYTFFIDRGYKEPQLTLPDKRVFSLPAAARLILSILR